MKIVFYLSLLFLFLVYSYSQIDLNLTLLQTSWFLSFQKTMINLGYFHRPLSTMLFLGLIFLLSIFYFLFSRSTKNLTLKQVGVLLVALSLLGLFSYPAFSHDIFNYIFDARILVKYQQDPYTLTALNFPDDTWTRFMRWTHRTYPYGPFFLPISAVFYFLGMDKFILTLLLFKLMIVFSFLGSVWLLGKIGGVKAVVYFALNPLIIIEGLVAAHMDMLMLVFVLLAIFFLLRHFKFWPYLPLLLSAGIKYVTVLFLPVFLFNDQIAKRYVTYIFVLTAYAGAVAQVFSRELLPHYFIIPIGITAVFLGKRWVNILGVVLSLVLIWVRYIPYLLTGQWVTIF